MRDTFEMVLSDRDFELMVEDNQYIKLSEFGFDRTQLRMLGINQLEQMVSYCNEYLQKEKQEFRKS
jgi:hypothetical protein